MKIFFSNSKNPYLNLARENYFLRTRNNSSSVLFIYQNEACVVCGKFQNPWQEMNLTWMKRNNFLPVRRMSGGGCVVHDEGNLNFSWIEPSETLDKNLMLNHLEIILKKLDYPVSINHRHDLVLNLNLQDYKISGSAYKKIKKTYLHHATLLIKSDLKNLSLALKSPIVFSESKSIPSVRSPVRNLSDHKDISVDEIMSFIAEYFSLSVEIFDETCEQIESDELHFKSDSFIFGETPYFLYQDSFGKFSQNKGIIQKLEVKGENQNQWVGEVFNQENLFQISADWAELFFSGPHK